MRWIFRAVAFVVVLILVAAVSLLFLPKERIARMATDQLSDVTGRDVSVQGNVGLTLWPVLGVRVEELQVGGPAWSTQGPTLKAAVAAVGVDALSLLSGEIHITYVNAQSPVIRLEQKADGRASWDFADTEQKPKTPPSTPKTSEAKNASNPAPAPESQSTSTRSLRLDALQVSDATVIFDKEGSSLVRYENLDLELDWPDPFGAATVLLNAQPGGKPITASANIDQFRAFLAGKQQAVKAKLETSAGSLDFDGRGSTDWSVAGHVNLQTDTTDGFLQDLGFDRVDLPPSFGREIKLSTGLTFAPSDQSVALRDLALDLGGNRVTGRADISFAGVPQIDASLNAGALDLRAVLAALPDAPDQSKPKTSESAKPKSKSASKSNSDTADWSTDKIDASGLSAFNGKIALNADSIDLGSFKLGATQAVLRNDNARMVFDLQKVVAYGGTVAGDVVLNDRSGFSVRAKLTASGIQMQPVLNDAIGFDRLTGAANLRVSFLGVGESIDAIMNSLSGDGQMDIGRGTILGFDLDHLMRGGPVGSGTTVFDSLSGSWSIDKGVLTNKDLHLQLKNYEARGEGTVGLGRQTLDYTFTPAALRANGGEGLAIPIRLRGPWSNVKIKPNLEAALEFKVGEEFGKLRKKTKKNADKSLKKRLKKVEDDLKDGLLDKIFD